MKKRNLLISIAFIAFSGCKVNKTETPPAAPVNPITETIWGMEITDPYRYMENLEDTSVLNWFKSQSEYTRNALDNISGRQGLLDKLWEFDKRKSNRIYNVVITKNDKYFYLKETPKDETGKLFFRDGYNGTERLLFDPEIYKDDSMHYSLSGLSPSLQGSKISFEIAPDGSESSELLIMDVESAELFPEVIDRCWFTAASWLPGEKQFLYFRFNSDDVHDMARELNGKSFLHTVGQSPETDIEIFSRAKYPELGIREKDLPLIYYDENADYLFGYPVTVDNRLKVFIAPGDALGNENIDWKPLFTLEDEIYNFGVTQDEIYLYTPKNAPNFKILKTSIKNPDIENAEVIVPEDSDAKIESFTLTSNGLIYTTLKYGVEQELYYLPKGQSNSKKIELPVSSGRITLTSKSINSPDAWVTLNGWTTDYKRYRFVPETNEFIPEPMSSQAEYPEFENLVIEELMIPSHDGVKVPVSLIYDENLTMDGNNPVYIYGYGAYGISVKPFFSPSYLLPTTHGAIFAIAHVRGGGELGDLWHKAGFKATKPNTWKDLIACAEYLVDNNYTSKGKIAINGGSAGGILIGRALTERPDLFGAAIPEVGCLNPMRQEFSPNGPVNIPEFGTIKDSAECLALYEMDSYHHIMDGDMYPATLITAGMNDPRVIVWQPAKFAARLQAANASDNPILLLVDFKSGHGIGDSKTTYYESIADKQSFALWQTGHPDFNPR